MTSAGGLKYRPDIDGLRAVAVLSVVCCHLNFLFHGGFVGVDIFFTISGFLIGSIILSETASGAFTFTGFYARRIRRIFPALFVMMLVSFIGAYYALLPMELMDFARSMAAAAGSFSNIYFWSKSGYFSQLGLSTPLLHTWSLGVEEQFYLALPIVLVMLRCFAARRIHSGIYAIAAVSFGLSIYGTRRYPIATFYMPHTRAWELLMGVMLALENFPRIQRPAVRNIAGIAGGLLIAVAVCFYREWTPYPGLAALAPCGGAALLIAAGQTGPNVLGRILSLTPIKFIGRMSYSLYLWHWPVIACAGYGLNIASGLGRHQNQAAMLALSFALGVMSWRFVEVPFRSGRWVANARITFSGAAALLLTVIALSGSIIFWRGAPWRFSPREVNLASYIYEDRSDPRSLMRYGVCFVASDNASARDFSVSKCLPEKPGQPKVLVFGDSHAAAMWFGLNDVLQGVNVMQATAARCIPVVHQPPRQDPECTQLMDYILTQYLMQHKVDAVLLQAHWYPVEVPQIQETVLWLRARNIPVILSGPIPRYDSQLPRLLVFAMRHNDPELPTRHIVGMFEDLDHQLAALARDSWHVPYISLFDLLCQDHSCIHYAAPDVPFLSDADHMTKLGSILLAKKILALGVLPRAGSQEAVNTH